MLQCLSSFFCFSSLAWLIYRSLSILNEDEVRCSLLSIRWGDKLISKVINFNDIKFTFISELNILICGVCGCKVTLDCCSTHFTSERQRSCKGVDSIIVSLSHHIRSHGMMFPKRNHARGETELFSFESCLRNYRRFSGTGFGWNTIHFQDSFNVFSPLLALAYIEEPPHGCPTKWKLFVSDPYYKCNDHFGIQFIH